jgi:LmbE family N-acetylglucosaminyl deacetylase
MTIRLLGAFAHPDDDVYSLGATLVAHAGEVDATLVFVTSGEAGPITDPDAVAREELGEVREAEQRAAMSALGVEDATRARFLRFPDYHLPDVPIEDVVARLTEIMVEVRPDVVVTFGPDGMTSHHDHIRVGEAALAAFDRLDGDEAPAYLFQTALPRSAVDRFYDGLDLSGYGKEGDLFNVTGVPDERIAVRFDARPYATIKLEGILAHRTQVCEWERIPASVRWIFLEEEAFVQARPRIDAVEARGDLFVGVGDPARGRP